jgi:hypothetical protein
MGWLIVQLTDLVRLLERSDAGCSTILVTTVEISTRTTLNPYSMHLPNTNHIHSLDAWTSFEVIDRRKVNARVRSREDSHWQISLRRTSILAEAI